MIRDSSPPEATWRSGRERLAGIGGERAAPRARRRAGRARALVLERLERAPRSEPRPSPAEASWACHACGERLGCAPPCRAERRGRARRTRPGAARQRACRLREVALRDRRAWRPSRACASSRSATQAGLVGGPARAARARAPARRASRPSRRPASKSRARVVADRDRRDPAARATRRRQARGLRPRARDRARRARRPAARPPRRAARRRLVGRRADRTESSSSSAMRPRSWQHPRRSRSSSSELARARRQGVRSRVARALATSSRAAASELQRLRQPRCRAPPRAPRRPPAATAVPQRGMAPEAVEQLEVPLGVEQALLLVLAVQLEQARAQLAQRAESVDRRAVDPGAARARGGAARAGPAAGRRRARRCRAPPASATIDASAAPVPSSNSASTTARSAPARTSDAVGPRAADRGPARRPGSTCRRRSRP